MLLEKRYGVWLYSDRVGSLNQRGDYTWFKFSEDYIYDSNRTVLGLIFEQDLRASHANALRLPPWFSNLLPEGILRDWIAQERQVSVDREMELLAQVGHDLPGAVRILAEQGAPEPVGWKPSSAGPDLHLATPRELGSGWRFSLAGVGLKFSMLKRGDRLTLPAFGEGGDWIVKLPDPLHRDLPSNEHAMMALAARVGINVPEHVLVHRDSLDNLPPQVWPTAEVHAYAVRRFDRTEEGGRVHIEDLAQVRNIYPYGGAKYQGNFETVANLIYRGRHTEDLREFTRRLAFNILISNGDAHLKNWSLIYRDRRAPTLSPAYDLVSTRIYQVGDPEDLGLKFDRNTRFNDITLDSFMRLERRLNAKDADLVGCVIETVENVTEAWPWAADLLEGYPNLREDVAASVAARRRSLLRTVCA